MFHVEWVEMETELMEKLFKDQFPFHPRTTNGNYILGNEVSVLNPSILPITKVVLTSKHAAVLRTVAKFFIGNKENSTIVLEL